MKFFKSAEKPTTSIVEIVDRKTKIHKAKTDEKATGQHKHYFSKREVATPGIDPCCKVCGKHLSELTLERKIQSAGERFRSASNRLKNEPDQE